MNRRFNAETLYVNRQFLLQEYKMLISLMNSYLNRKFFRLQIF